MRLSGLHPPWVPCRVFNSHNVTNDSKSDGQDDALKHDLEDEEASCSSATVASTATWSSVSVPVNNSSGNGNLGTRHGHDRHSFSNPRQLLQNVFRHGSSGGGGGGGGGGYASRASLVMMRNQGDFEDDDDELDMEVLRRSSFHGDWSDSVTSNISYVSEDGSVSHASPVCAKYPGAAEATFRHVTRHRGSFIARELNWSIKPDVLLDNGIESNPIHELPSSDEDEMEDEEEGTASEEEKESHQAEASATSGRYFHRHQSRKSTKVVRLRRRYYVRSHQNHRHCRSALSFCANSTNEDAGEEEEPDCNNDCAFARTGVPSDHSEDDGGDAHFVISQCPNCGFEQQLYAVSDEETVDAEDSVIVTDESLQEVAEEVLPEPLPATTTKSLVQSEDYHQEAARPCASSLIASETSTVSDNTSSWPEQRPVVSTKTPKAMPSLASSTTTQPKVPLTTTAPLSLKAGKHLLKRTARHFHNRGRSDHLLPRFDKAKMGEKDDDDDDQDDDEMFAAVSWWRYNTSITLWLQDSSAVSCSSC